MGFVVPPPPITREEFKKRWDEGARTVEELDPRLAKWARSGIIGLFLRRRTNSILTKRVEGMRQ